MKAAVFDASDSQLAAHVMHATQSMPEQFSWFHATIYTAIANILCSSHFLSHTLRMPVQLNAVLL